METINILYIGGHLEILATVVRLINANENWNGVGVMNDEEAKEIFLRKDFSLVLFGSGIQEESETNLCAFFNKQNPNIILFSIMAVEAAYLKVKFYSLWKTIKISRNKKKAMLMTLFFVFI